MERREVSAFVLITLILVSAGAVVNYLPEDDQRMEADDNGTVQSGEQQVVRNHDDGPDSTPEHDPAPVRVTDAPTDQRYFNEFVPRTPPRWIPESGFERESIMRVKTTIEVTRYPNVEPSEQHLEDAWEFYSDSYDAAVRNDWFDYDVAREEGYKRYGPTHYIKKEYFLDDETLNPEKPETLMYYPHPENESRKVLAGIMYFTDGMEKEGEQVAGPLTIWHYHRFLEEICMESALSLPDYLNEFEETECPEDSKKVRRSPEMIHIWFLNHPEGPFSSSMTLDSNYSDTQGKLSETEFKEYALESYRKYDSR